MAARPPLALNAPHRAHGAARDTRPPPAPPVVTAGRPSPAPFGARRLRPILRSPAASERTRRPAGPVPPSVRSPPWPSLPPGRGRPAPVPARPARPRPLAGRSPPSGGGCRRGAGRPLASGCRTVPAAGASAPVATGSRRGAAPRAPLGAGGDFVPSPFPLPRLPSSFAFDGRHGPAPPSLVPAARARTAGAGAGGLRGSGGRRRRGRGGEGRKVRTRKYTRPAAARREHPRPHTQQCGAAPPPPSATFPPALEKPAGRPLPAAAHRRPGRCGAGGSARPAKEEVKGARLPPARHGGRAERGCAGGCRGGEASAGAGGQAPTDGRPRRGALPSRATGRTERRRRRRKRAAAAEGTGAPGGKAAAAAASEEGRRRRADTAPALAHAAAAAAHLPRRPPRGRAGGTGGCARGRSRAAGAGGRGGAGRAPGSRPTAPTEPTPAEGEGLFLSAPLAPSSQQPPPPGASLAAHPGGHSAPLVASCSAAPRTGISSCGVLLRCCSPPNLPLARAGGHMQTRQMFCAKEKICEGCVSSIKTSVNVMLLCGRS